MILFARLWLGWGLIAAAIVAPSAALLGIGIGALIVWRRRWASEFLHEEVVLRDENFARDLIRALAERAPTGADMGYLGAGPIEDFATNEDRLRWIEAEAARSRNFRAALANVYPRPRLSEEQNARLRRAAEVD